MRSVNLASIMLAGASSLALFAGCCSSGDAVKTKVVYVDREVRVEVPTLVEVGCRCGCPEKPCSCVPQPPKLTPLKKSPCSAQCTCGCNAGGVCACRTPKASESATPKVSGGCYIDANGRQVCPNIKR